MPTVVHGPFFEARPLNGHCAAVAQARPSGLAAFWAVAVPLAQSAASRTAHRRASRPGRTHPEPCVGQARRAAAAVARGTSSTRRRGRCWSALSVDQARSPSSCVGRHARGRSRATPASARADAADLPVAVLRRAAAGHTSAKNGSPGTQSVSRRRSRSRNRRRHARRAEWRGPGSITGDRRSCRASSAPMFASLAEPAAVFASSKRMPANGCPTTILYATAATRRSAGAA